MAISKIKIFVVAFLLASSLKTQSLFAVVVTSLRYTAVSSTSLSLAWDDAVGNTDGYRMFISTVPGFSITIASGTTPDGVATTSYVNLQPNTTHTFVVKETSDPESYYLAISTYTHAVSPGIVGFNIYETSASIILNSGLNNLNATSTPLVLAVSTGNGGDFNVSLASSGFVTSAVSTFVITGLSVNTNYAFQASATNYFGLRSTATTVTSSTNTLSASPIINSFQIFTTSISVVIGINGNATSTPVMIATGTNGDFNVSNSSIGAFSGGVPQTLVISNLSTSTAYSFQAGTRGTYSNASTQTVIITASTSTLAVAPTVVGFQVFSTSISVILGRNSNSVGTPIVISTLAASFSVSNSSSGVFGAGDTTLVISALPPNTDYPTNSIRAGAWDFSVGAVTQTAIVTASTTTLAAVPTVVGFEVFYSSISVTLGRNGNPAGTAIAISSGTSGHYAVSNASAGVYGTGNTTLVISNLSIGTDYGFQAGARDSSVNASTQSITVTASTTTNQEIGVLIVGPTTYNFGLIQMNVSTVTLSSFTIQNIGNVSEDYKIRATTNTPNTPWVLSSSQGTNQLVLYSVFNSTRPAVTDFGSEDALTYTDQVPDSTKFGMLTSSGTAAVVNEKRYLWLRMDTPTLTSTENVQEMLITITGRKTP